MKQTIQLANLAFKHPGLTQQKLREYWRKKLLTEKFLKNTEGSAQPPISLSLHLTYMCNLRCKMCNYWGTKGIYKETDTQYIKQLIPLAKYKEIIEEVAPFKPEIFFFGGEPFLYPQIIELVKIIKQHGLLCTLATNGTLLSKYAQEIVSLKIDSVNISLDGIPRIHDTIRGIPGTFEKAIQGARDIRKKQKELKINKPMLKVSYTLSEDNYTLAKEFINTPEIHQTFDLLTFALGWFNTKEISDSTSKIFRETFQCNSSSWEGFINALGKVGAKEVEELILFAKNKKHKIPIIFYPDIAPQAVKDYYQDPKNPMGKKRCLSPWLDVGIYSNGDVTLCPDFPDYIVGNINKEPLMKIWNNERSRRFRTELFKRGLFPICSRCCGLYAF